MAIISRGAKKTFVDEINSAGVFTQSEFEQHLAVAHTQGVMTTVAPYYFDSVRNKYLSHETERVMMYVNGTGKKNQYMYYAPTIVSSTIPYRIIDESCIVGYEYSIGVNLTGTMCQIQNKTDSTVLHTISFSTSKMYELNESLNILLTDTAQLRCYLGSASQSNPVIIVYIKKVYHP